MRKYLSDPVVLKVFTKSPVGLLLNPSPFLNVCDITIGSPVGNVLATLPCCRHRDARLCKIRAQTAEIGPLKISVPSRLQIFFLYEPGSGQRHLGPPSVLVRLVSFYENDLTNQRVSSTFLSQIILGYKFSPHKYVKISNIFIHIAATCWTVINTPPYVSLAALAFRRTSC